jgi:DNA-binding XRE family transcriptional regulator
MASNTPCRRAGRDLIRINATVRMPGDHSVCQGSNVTSKDTGFRVDMSEGFPACAVPCARRPLPFSEGDFLIQLGAQVRARRLLREMSRRELAGRSGVSERYIAQIEAGKGNVSIVLLLRIVHAVSSE